MFDAQIMSLFSIDAFRRMAANEAISMYQFFLIINALALANIPYDTSFDGGTRKAAASVQLTIHINPSATLVFVVSLEQGSSQFSPSP